MGQSANKSRTAANEAMAMAKYIKTSPQKLDLVAATIRGKNAGRALVDLEFSPRRVAQDVRKVLQSAIANAENNHGLDVDRLYVAEAYTGKSITMKRFRARARGRAARILKPFARMTIIVRERDDAAAPKAKKIDVTKAALKKADTKSDNKPAAEKNTPAKKTAKKTAAKKSPATAKKDKPTPNKTAEKKPAAEKPQSNEPAHTNAKDQIDPKQKTNRGSDN